MSGYVPLHVHSHFSLFDGISKPEQIAKTCKKLGHTACALTDHGSISGCVAFFEACKKEGIKPILGCELYVSEDLSNKDAQVSHIVVLAKNEQGWKNLIKVVSESHENFYKKPLTSLSLIEKNKEGLIGISGHPGSTLADIIFTTKDAYSLTEKDAMSYIRPGVTSLLKHAVEQHKQSFEDFYIESQLIDREYMLVADLIDSILRDVAKDTNTPIVATGDAHYCERKDVVDQRLRLCSSMKTTFREVHKMMNRDKTYAMGLFFRSNNYHIPSHDDIATVNQPEDIANTVKIAEMCEEYNILHPPMLPHFDCPDGMSEREYMRYLCEEGKKKKLSHLDESTLEKYNDRLEKELAVFEKAKLEGYFLIVQDYVNYAKSKGQLVGPARGSAAGCLTSYLLNITTIDPLEYDLIFERFYNEGRNTEDHIAYPDIDVDFPKDFRNDVINYVRQKYGEDKVCQVITFSRLQGKSALKEVLRIHEACSYEEMNVISNCLPNEAEISDKLEEAKEDSIIMWVLRHDPDRLKDYCTYDENGFHGDYAEYFEQAARIEGIYKSSGKHAAGIVISAVPLAEVCPMVHDSHGDEPIAGFEQTKLEATGQLKFDILAVDVLDTLMDINRED